MVVAVGLEYVFFGSISFPFLTAQVLPLLLVTCAMACPRVRDSPVVLDIELSVGSRHQKTRVLPCARRLVLLLVAAARGGVRQKFQNNMQ